MSAKAAVIGVMTQEIGKKSNNLFETSLKEVLISDDRMVLFDHDWVLQQTPEFSTTIGRICLITGHDVIKVDAVDLSLARMLDVLFDSDVQKSDEFSNYRRVCDEIESRQAGIILVKKAHLLTNDGAHILARLARYSRRNNLNWKVVLLANAAKLTGMVSAQLPLDNIYTTQVIETDEADTTEPTMAIEEDSYSAVSLAKYAGLTLLFLVPLIALLVHLSKIDIGEPSIPVSTTQLSNIPVAETPANVAIVEAPVVEAPVDEPAVEAPVDEPAVEAPVNEPVVEAPVDEPVVEAPIDEPIVEAPVDEPVVEAPIDQSVAEAPIDQPVVEAPVDEPVVEAPIDEPVVEAPVDQPVVEAPVDEPVVEAPVDQPVVEAPVDEPVVEAPVNEPVVEAPVDEAYIPSTRDKAFIPAPNDSAEVPTSKEGAFIPTTKEDAVTSGPSSKDDAYVPIRENASLQQNDTNELSDLSLDEVYDKKARDLEFQKELDAISRTSDQDKPLINPQRKTTTAPSMPVELYEAAQSGNLPAIQATFSDQASLNSVNQNGESALIIAITEGHVGLTDWLLTRRVNINQVDQEGRSPLFYATVAGNTALISRLISLGANPNSSSRLRKTPLMIAVHNDYFTAAQLLVDAGSQVNETDHSGWSALFYSVWNNNRDTTNLLLSRGANPQQKDSNGNTPIDIANSRPGNQLRELLLSAQLSQ